MMSETQRDAQELDDEKLEPDRQPAGLLAMSNHLAPGMGHREKLRIIEALLFASAEPLDARQIAAELEPGDDVAALLLALQDEYRGRGVCLVRVAGKWAFRTADDLSYVLQKQRTEERKLSRVALETLAIIAYHQPVTRAEIEGIRGVATSKGTLDVLLETGWIRPRGRRRAPGRPLTYGTTDAFLAHFGLDQISDLPGLAELKGMGLLDGAVPAGFKVPDPRDLARLTPDELPLDAAEEGETGDEEGDTEEPAERSEHQPGEEE